MGHVIDIFSHEVVGSLYCYESKTEGIDIEHSQEKVLNFLYILILPSLP
jgi:hypothetical protein